METHSKKKKERRKKEKKEPTSARNLTRNSDLYINRYLIRKKIKCFLMKAINWNHTVRKNEMNNS